MFTDVEGSTRRWEADPDGMRVALAGHDAVLRSAVESCGGWLFKHTGDGMCAAFASADDAVTAAVDAQRRLGLPVRMGIATGSAELRGDDYFGPALNRAARIMAAGHGGQILLAAATAALTSKDRLVDLGECRLRDLSGQEHVFQVLAEGLRVEFAALRTLDATQGNLTVPSTSLVGRDAEVTELVDLMRVHRMVTLTGVGGVGKTRLAVQVAAALTPEFPDGVWLVELAPVGDPAAVPDVVATTLGVTAQTGISVTSSVAQALSGRRLLVVLDNCEHVLDAAAEWVEAVLARVPTVKVLATSREGLRVGSERVWSVPSLEIGDGAGSPAVALFLERARAANSAFGVSDEAEMGAVLEICARLDGIALAIELAAARMVAMSPQEVRDRLGDRFRLLSGGRRGLERHQTLRHAVSWSVDLLTEDERVVLQRCAVFADGFDLAAAVDVCGGEFDEYSVLDVLDSLVRKSLVTVRRAEGRVRYGMLETVRQFAEDLLAATGSADAARDRHAAHFAARAQVAYDKSWGPDQGVALDWSESEFANLRIGFRWAADRGDLDSATAIAAHTAVIMSMMQRFEPVAWVEEMLDAATRADVAQLPRLYTAASLCSNVGRAAVAISYAETAVALEADPKYDPFVSGLSTRFLAVANGHAGRVDRWLDLHDGLIVQTGRARVYGLTGRLYALSVLGRSGDARAIAEDAVSAARAHGNPSLIAYALLGYARAYADTNPAYSLNVLHDAFEYANEHRVALVRALIAREAAHLEATHGQPEHALTLFDATIDELHRAGNVAHLPPALVNLAALFDRIDRPHVAATLYGSTMRHVAVDLIVDIPALVDRLRGRLGPAAFDECAAAGASMSLPDAAQYARRQIDTMRHELPPASDYRPEPWHRAEA